MHSSGSSSWVVLPFFCFFRSSRHGINGSFDLILAHRLQQEVILSKAPVRVLLIASNSFIQEYWAMHKKQPKGKKASNTVAAPFEPLKRSFETSLPVATTGAHSYLPSLAQAYRTQHADTARSSLSKHVALGINHAAITFSQPNHCRIVQQQPPLRMYDTQHGHSFSDAQ
jgi:hypothetical protein